MNVTKNGRLEDNGRDTERLAFACHLSRHVFKCHIDHLSQILYDILRKQISLLTKQAVNLFDLLWRWIGSQEDLAASVWLFADHGAWPPPSLLCRVNLSSRLARTRIILQMCDSDERAVKEQGDFMVSRFGDEEKGIFSRLFNSPFISQFDCDSR